VLGVDPDEGRRTLAEGFGATAAAPDDAEAAAAMLTDDRGVDGVLVCASTSSSEPLRAAARMCRQRGRIVLVGVTGMELERSELYEKELSFQVSCSYGAGRYEPSYEGGHDYPFGLVRWTAGRNMEAALDLMASGQLDVEPLITHRFPFEEAPRAYDVLVKDRTALGIVLQYGEQAAPAPALRRLRALTVSEAPNVASTGDVALIGAGNFAVRTLIPAIGAAGGRLALIADRGGVSSGLAAERAGARATTDLDALFADPSLGSVVVATRHDSHAGLAERALRSGKAVYVEKPLALTHEALDELESARKEAADGGGVPVLMVGFNRRFAPISTRMKELLRRTAAPKQVIITVNAGKVPADHWTQDPAIGGGRIIGEGCHFIDLARHLVGKPITEVATGFLGPRAADSATISLTFEDSSRAEIHYLANGSPRFPKERVEVFCQGRVLVNGNFKSLRTYSWPGARGMRLLKQDKGHRAAVAAFLQAARSGGPAPIPFDELIEVSRASIEAARPS
jgi:predicted dehydrogenase